MGWRFLHLNREFLILPAGASLSVSELRRGYEPCPHELPWEALLEDPLVRPQVAELLRQALQEDLPGTIAPGELAPLADRLRRACERGELLVLLRRGTSGSWIGYQEPEPPPPPAPAPPPAPVADSWIEIRLVDDDGRPIAHRTYRLDLTDGTSEEAELPASATVRRDGIPEGDCTFTVTELDVEDEPPGDEPPETDLKTVQLLEFEDAFFRTKSSVLLPELQEAPSGASPEGPPTTTGLVATVLQYAADHPDQKLLVAGHTDTTGADAYNVPLSKNRAWAVQAAIAGDREGFKDACDGPHLSGKQEKADVTLKDRLQILDWVAATFGWPCGLAQNAGDYFRAVRAFQKSYNDNGKAGNAEGETLTVDGDWGKKTWGAVYDCYEARLCEALGVDRAGLSTDYRGKLQWVAANTPYTGCGEYHPIDNLGADNYRSQANRRVEVLFFDPGEEPQLECFGGGCAKQACALFDPSKYARIPLTPGGGPPPPGGRTRPLDLLLYDATMDPATGRSEYAGLAYTLTLDGADFTGQVTDQGRIQQEIPAAASEGRLTLELVDGEDKPYSIEWPIKVDPIPEPSTPQGASIRLRNLAYYHGEIVETLTDELRESIGFFQVDWDLPNKEGELDDPTAEKLKALHDDWRQSG